MHMRRFFENTHIYMCICTFFVYSFACKIILCLWNILSYFWGLWKMFNIFEFGVVFIYFDVTKF